MLDATEIATGETADDCAHAAVINLYKLRGLPPPSIERLRGQFGMMASAARLESGVYARATGRTSEREGPTPFEVVALLAADTRFFVTLGIIPPAVHHNPAPVFRHHLDAGCHLLVCFAMYDPYAEEAAEHVVVAEGYDERGLIVLDGNSGYFDGTTIELMPERLTDEEAKRMEEADEAGAHGSRRVLPCYPCARPPAKPFGILPHFIVVHPAETVQVFMRQANEEAERRTAGVKSIAMPTAPTTARSLVDQSRPWLGQRTRQAAEG